MKEVKSFGRILVVAALMSLVACDPGMTVRQITSFVQSENAAAVGTHRGSLVIVCFEFFRCFLHIRALN